MGAPSLLGSAGVVWELLKSRGGGSVASASAKMRRASSLPAAEAHAVLPLAVWKREPGWGWPEAGA